MILGTRNAVMPVLLQGQLICAAMDMAVATSARDLSSHVFTQRLTPKLGMPRCVLVPSHAQLFSREDREISRAFAAIVPGLSVLAVSPQQCQMHQQMLGCRMRLLEWPQL